MLKTLRLAALLMFLAPAAAHAYSADVYAVCNLDPQGDNFLALRKGPSSRAAMIMRLAQGTEVEDWGKRGRWMEVDVLVSGRPSGWVYSAYLCLAEDH